jgi:putative transposase
MSNNDETTSRASSRHLAHLAPLAATPLVFLTVTTHDRRRILGCREAHEELAAIWTRSAEHDGWFVGNYVIMPDHIHLFVRSAWESRRLSDWVGMWKSVSSRTLGRRLGLEGHVWQAEYFDRFLRSGESYSEKWEYVEQNPVRAGLVANAVDWPFKGQIHELRF